MNGEQDILNQLWRIYNNFQELIRHADNKAQINIVIASIFIGISASFSQELSFISEVFMISSIVLMVVSVIVAIFIIHPRLNIGINTMPSPFFFRDVAEDNSLITGFESLFDNPQKYRDYLKREVIKLSIIAKKKFYALRIMTLLIAVGITLSGLLVILYFINH